MELSIVLSTNQTNFQAATFSGSLEQNLEKIAGMGYQGVELAIRDPNMVDLEALYRMVSSFGLEVPAIGTGQAWNEEKLSFTDPDEAVRQHAVERIISHVRAAKHFNAVIIIGLLRGIVKPGVSQDQAIGWLVEALVKCCRAAAKEGVRLALEPINRYETTLINTVSQGMALVSSVSEDNFGLLLDTFHMNIEEPQIETSIRACGSRIFHFHVADSNRWYPGNGHIDFKSVLSSLIEAGYDGYVSGEFLPQPTADEAAIKSIAFLKPLLEELTPDL